MRQKSESTPGCASRISRRQFSQCAALFVGAIGTPSIGFSRSLAYEWGSPLRQFEYRDVVLASTPHERQLDEQLALLMSLSDDSLLKPFRQMIGQPAPGEDLGGWYRYDPLHAQIEGAYAPSATFGQWVSALSRMYAIRGEPAIRAKVLRLNRLYAQTIDGQYYDKNRFPAYCYDKLVCGLIDAHQFAQDADAFTILKRTTDTALPHLPGRAIENGVSWRPGKDASYNSDESYTLSENLFLAYQRGAGRRYRSLGAAYLDDGFFDPLSENRSSLAGRHAYSYINALSSAMQAYLTMGSGKHLRAAKAGFAFLSEQSFATGGWGPDETLLAPESSALFDSLTTTHRSFETPCGSYAHFKLTRYLLRVTRDARYGDSMERIMYNCILGAKASRADGSTFYYSDYNTEGRKAYSDRRWPCCSGTLPQVAADYRINAYFHDRDQVYVNLYIPSTLHWDHAGAGIALTQRSDYPFDGAIEFQLKMSVPVQFALNLRIPVWAIGASVSVNGERLVSEVAAGNFFQIRRNWKSGDRVQLELPLRNRLEAIDAQHPQTVALLSGPLVLFAMTQAQPAVTRSQLLAARKANLRTWQTQTNTGPLTFMSFPDIEDQPYVTYLRPLA